MTEQRKIWAFLLSAVILPTLLMAPMHRHVSMAETDGVVASASVACAGCESHIPHSHLNDVPHAHECLVCQFLTVVWLISAEEHPVAPAEEYFDGIVDSLAKPALSSVRMPGLRAPPVVFC